MQLPVVETGALSENVNSKLGPFIHSWSIPASAAVCVGASNLCSSHCYAKRGFYCYPKTAAFLERNEAFSRTPHFAPWVISQLYRNPVQVLRIHCSGDFYDLAYIEKWAQIVRRCVRVTFFAYTRSWRRPELLPNLIQLTRYANMHLWFSHDRETGLPPYVPGVRRAYMAVNDFDAAGAPPDSDLVFRVRTKTVLKRANGVLVCPTENGVAGKLKHTCTSCGFCWNKTTPRWQASALPAADDGIALMAPLLEPPVL